MRTEKDLYKTELDRWVDIQRTQREEWAKAHDIREEEIDKKEPGLTEKDYCPGCHQPYFLICHSTKEGWETWQGLCPYCTVRFLNNHKNMEGYKMEKAIAIQNETGVEVSVEQTRTELSEISAFQKLVRSSLVSGKDYGVIPGTDKPTLLKPGAEKLAKLMRLTDEYEILSQIEDWDKPFFAYKIKCKLISLVTGKLISEGIGEANSYESKWRYRWVFENNIPSGYNISELPKQERFSKKTGKKFFVYRIQNEDIFSQVNTILKICKKRALVDATLSAGRLSDLFTQDLEDLHPEIAEEIQENGQQNNIQKSSISKPEDKPSQANDKPHPLEIKAHELKKKLQDDEAYYKLLGQHGAEHITQLRMYPERLAKFVTELASLVNQKRVI